MLSFSSLACAGNVLVMCPPFLLCFRRCKHSCAMEMDLHRVLACVFVRAGQIVYEKVYVCVFERDMSLVGVKDPEIRLAEVQKRHFFSYSLFHT